MICSAEGCSAASANSTLAGRIRAAAKTTRIKFSPNLLGLADIFPLRLHGLVGALFAEATGAINRLVERQYEKVRTEAILTM